ncbi:MAG: glycerophosphodiester phosphodiesterase [Armatimonadetes bacterium]|nr:glycerophosphodiester phosphodiesterase [Armatimonadota bacterium]
MASRIRPFFIVGHRGAPQLMPPGNTVASLHKAVEVGAQMLEVDVRRTRDDVLVLDHEAVRWVAGQETPLSAQSYAQWRDYTAETDAPLATLDDAFLIASEAGVGLMLDFKEPGTENLVARAIRRSGFPLDRLLVAGAGEASRRTLRGLDPRIPLSLSLDVETAPPIDARLLAALDTDAVTWHYRLLTPAVVKVLHLRGILVYVWTVDLTDDMRRMRDMGVDGIITNSPDLLRSL